MKLLPLLVSVMWFLNPSLALAEIEPQNLPAATPPTPAPTPVLTRAPELVEFVAASYPTELMDQGIGGQVQLFIDINETGSVDSVEVVTTSHPAFVEPAIAAAKAFKFLPAEIDGKPAGIRIEYLYHFEPQALVIDALVGEPPPQNQALLPVNLKGRVREAGIRKSVPQAVIQVNGRAVAETDSDGRFEIRGAPVGTFTVRLSAPGFDSYELDETLAADQALEVNYYLVRLARSPYETVVRTRAARQEVAKVELSRQELTKVPGTFGDPVRVIENLPGMGRTPGGLGGALLVRGERPSSTAVYMDGVAIPQLYHFGGLTSVVNAEFLEKIDFYPGGFGARYGDATAGIVEVTTRDLNCDIVHGSAKADLIDASAYACVPADSWRVAASGRRSYIDLLLPTLIDQVQNDPGTGSFTIAPRYWDYQAKADRLFGDHALTLFAFGADDRLTLIQTGSAEDVNINFGTHLLFHRFLLRDRWRLNDRMTLTSSLAPGFTRNDFTVGAKELDFSFEFRLPIYTLDWREDFTFKVSPELTVNAGLDHRMGRAVFSMDNPMPTYVVVYPGNTFTYTATQPYKRTMKGFTQGYWVEAVIQPTDTLKLVPGLRLDRWDFYKTQGYSLMPRATARWEFLPGSTAKAAYGLYEKLPEAFYLLDRIGNPNLDPQRAHHFVLGLEQVFTPVINLDLQGFYNLKSRNPEATTAQTSTDSTLSSENFASTATGRAYGLELLLRHLATADGTFYGWISYTLSRSLERDRSSDTTAQTQTQAGNNDPVLQPSREHISAFDQTHILTVVGQWVLPYGFEFGLRFRLVTGNPYTPLDQGTPIFDGDSDSYSLDLTGVKTNSKRMPNFKQLDLRIDRTFTFDLWKLTPYLELINATYAKNVESYQYDFRYRKKSALTLLPILPVLGVKGEF